ncbi:MAG TPA: ATP-binding protein [Rhodocyclaceae bacterium]|nr:ATP-binding protein [Rhodocyclaceae bacterium]
MLGHTAADDITTQDERSSNRANMQLLIQLRWIAVAGQVATIAFVHFVFMIALPLHAMLLVLALLVAYNVFSYAYWRVPRGGENRAVSNTDLFVSLLIDVIALTAQLYFSGGAVNPFCFLYLLQIILGAVMLRPGGLWSLIVVSTACFAALSVVYVPLALPHGYDNQMGPPYIEGTLVCYAINAALLALFITHINRNQRARDARIADMRQRAAEEEHIVRMGLLASGAAHELSTPLSTLAVILGDWQHMPHIAANPEVAKDIDEMQVQIQRCKSIVSNILLSAGEARGEDPVETTMHAFLDELVFEWRQTRPVADFSYDNQFGEDLPIISDSAFKQTICNVLDNALEASPQWVGLKVTRRDDMLVLAVSDAGSGFAPEMLDHLGKPYQSSKGRPGRGLGLFLVVNVLRTLGGTVAARNRAAGGAVVTLSMPLAAIQMNGDADAAATPQPA